MIGPVLHMAVVAALKTSGVANGAVYYHVPQGEPTPYVHVDTEQAIDDGDQCAEMFDVYLDIHVWAEATALGKIAAMEIGSAVRQALINPPAVDGYAVILHEFENSRLMLDPEEATHGILTFRFLLQPV